MPVGGSPPAARAYRQPLQRNAKPRPSAHVGLWAPADEIAKRGRSEAEPLDAGEHHAHAADPTMPAGDGAWLSGH